MGIQFPRRIIQMKQNMFKVLAVVLVVAMCAVMFTACVPSDPDKALANLKDNSYEATLTKASDASGLGSWTMPSGCETVVTGYNANGTALDLSDDDSVRICYFKDADSAKVYFEKEKKQIDDYKIELKAELDKKELTQAEYDKALADIKESKLGKSGKVVYSGTKAGVKAAS